MLSTEAPVKNLIVSIHPQTLARIIEEFRDKDLLRNDSPAEELRQKHQQRYHRFRMEEET